jgi:S-disulfanyl-L-cysteine oxidoreductase SoxD
MFIEKKIFKFTILCIVAASCTSAVGSESVTSADTSSWPSSFGFGRVARRYEIDSLNIDVSPDGTGLPAGSGRVHVGRTIYVEKCASCHGKSGVEGPYSKLVAIYNEADSVHNNDRAIGNYWPYATTLFDYINRAMPYNAPGTLTADEVYSVTAFLLYQNEIIDSSIVIDSRNLPQVEMPAKKLFVEDDRRGGPEVK